MALHIPKFMQGAITEEEVEKFLDGIDERPNNLVRAQKAQILTDLYLDKQAQKRHAEVMASNDAATTARNNYAAALNVFTLILAIATAAHVLFLVLRALNVI